MTDQELLELAAKAAGIEIDHWRIEPMIHDSDYDVSEYRAWNPLTNDGDALRLAVNLCIEVSPCDGVVIVNYPFGPNRELFEIFEYIHSDRCEATRRAIVRAAAEIGKDMK